MPPTGTELGTAESGPVANPMSEPPLERGLLTSCDETKSGPPPQRVWMLTPEQMPATVASLYAGHTTGPAIEAVTDANRAGRLSRSPFCSTV